MADESKLFRQFEKPKPVKLVHPKTGERLKANGQPVPPISFDEFVEEGLNGHPRWKQEGWKGIERRRRIMAEIRDSSRVVTLPEDDWSATLESCDPSVLNWTAVALDQLQVHYDALANAKEVSGAELADRGGKRTASESNGKARPNGSSRAKGGAKSKSSASKRARK